MKLFEELVYVNSMIIKRHWLEFWFNRYSKKPRQLNPKARTHKEVILSFQERFKNVRVVNG